MNFQAARFFRRKPKNSAPVPMARKASVEGSGTSRHKSTFALRHRKRLLLARLEIRPDCLRASLVERFSRCGKGNCQCQHGGDKHGPYYYLT